MLLKSVGTRSRYAVVLYNEMGNATKKCFLPSQEKLDDFLYALDDKQLFKAYIHHELYCKHIKL